MSPEHFSRVVFCDFDGTITVNETLRKVFKHFLGEAGAKIIAQLDTGEITLRETLIRLVALLRSDQKQEIIDYISPEPVRPGFSELLDYLQDVNIPFVVVSSGFGFYIEHMLAPWREKIHAVHALQIDTSGEMMQLRITHNHPFEAMAKEWVMNEYDCDERIAIGDALSDFNMAEAAQIVFARATLLKEMQSKQKPVNAYEDFFDVLNAMKEGREARVGAALPAAKRS